MITLTQREKLLLRVLIILVSAFAAYRLVLLPLISFAVNTDDEVNKKIEELDRLEKLYKQYREIQEKKSYYTEILNKRNENTTSLIEQWANTTGISKNIAYTRNNQSGIQNKYIRITSDIRIEGVAIQQFLKFLYEVENSDNLIRVNYLKINPALKGTNTYDVNMKIDNFVAK